MFLAEFASTFSKIRENEFFMNEYFKEIQSR